MISVAQHLIELSHYHPYDKKNSNLCPRFIPSTLSIVLEAAVCKPIPQLTQKPNKEVTLGSIFIIHILQFSLSITTINFWRTITSSHTWMPKWENMETKCKIRFGSPPTMCNDSRWSSLKNDNCPNCVIFVALSPSLRSGILLPIKTDELWKKCHQLS